MVVCAGDDVAVKFGARDVLPIVDRGINRVLVEVGDFSVFWSF